MANSSFLLFLLCMRIATSTKLLSWQPTAYELRSSWALFLLYECHKTLFVYVPLSPVLGPMLVRIRLMVTRDLVNFTLLMALLVASSAIAIKATLFPDLSAQPEVVAETFEWTFQQLFITDLGTMLPCFFTIKPISKPFFASRANANANCCPIKGLSAKHLAVMQTLGVPPNIGLPSSPSSNTSFSSNCSVGPFFLPFSRAQPNELRRKPTGYGSINFTHWPPDSGSNGGIDSLHTFPVSVHAFRPH